MLDLCCGVAGPGRFITRELGCAYLGVDSSADAIDIAHERAGDLPCRFEVAHVPPLPTGPFDVVLLLEMMLAFPTSAPAWRRSRRRWPRADASPSPWRRALPLTGAEREWMPDADTVWLTPLEEMLSAAGAGRARRPLAGRLQSRAPRRGDALIEAFVADAADIAAQIGQRALDELLAAHRLWSDWLGSGRVRKFAVVAEKTARGSADRRPQR